MTPCLNCDGWGCAQCALDREEARGGEQGPSALDLTVEQLRRERDQLAASALTALAAAGICTPAEGYVAAPHCLAWDITKLCRERNDARAAAMRLREAVRALLRSEHAIFGHEVSWCSSVADYNAVHAALTVEEVAT